MTRLFDWRGSRKTQGLASQQAERLEGHRRNKAELTDQRSELESQRPQSVPDTDIQTARNYLSFLETYVAAILDQLENLAALRFNRSDILRFVLWFHGVRRPVKLVDPTDAILKVLPFFMAEVAMVTGLLYADGKMGLVIAAAYAITFAISITAAGLIAGRFYLRYAFFRSRSTAPEPRDASMRLAARAGFVALLGLIGLVLFASARTRAVGDHSGIWNYSTVSFVDTFNSSISLIILLIGVLGAIIATDEGFRGIGEPIPGLGRAKRHAHEGVDAEAAALVEHAGDHIEDHGQQIINGLLDIADTAQETADETVDAIAAYNRDCDAHNAAIDKSIADLKADTARQQAIQARISPNKPATPFEIDVEAFDALRVERIDPAGFTLSADEKAALNEARALANQIEAAIELALLKLDAAYADYRFNNSDTDLFFDPQGGSNA
jgi:hypothetical protein